MPDSTGPTPRTSKVWSTWKWVGGPARPEVGPCVWSAALPAVWPSAGAATSLELCLEWGGLADTALPASLLLAGVGTLPELWPAVAASAGAAAAASPWLFVCVCECPLTEIPLAEWLPNSPTSGGSAGRGSAALLVHPEPFTSRPLATACASRAAACCPLGTLPPAAASCCASSPCPCSLQRCSLMSRALWHGDWCPGRGARWQLRQAERSQPSKGAGSLQAGAAMLHWHAVGWDCLTQLCIKFLQCAAVFFDQQSTVAFQHD